MTLQEYNNLYSQSFNKQMSILASSGISITNTNICQESMSLEESLCSDTNIKFGTCEASCFKIQIADLNHNFVGEWLDVTQYLLRTDEGYLLLENGDYFLLENGDKLILTQAEATSKYGRFKVFSDKPSNDRVWRDIVAYDAMYDIINADVAEWYKSLVFPMTIKALRDSFFEYLEIEQEDISLINDNFITEGGFSVEGTLSGKVIIEAICELNGVFGHINRDGVFTYVSLSDTDRMTYNWYIDGTGSYEDYETLRISGVKVQDSVNDLGTSVGNMVNPYVISINPLVYGSEGTQNLTTALTNLLNKIRRVTYRPFAVEAYGIPQMEVGTAIRLNTRNQVIDSYVIKRTLSGIQALSDSISATGEEKQSTMVNNLTSQIQRTKGKVHEIVIDIDQLTSRISSAEENISTLDGEVGNVYTKTETESLISQTASSIESRVSQTYETKTDATDKLNTANRNAQNYANTAESNANSTTDNKLTNYYTKSETNSEISQSADNITLSVSQTYETKADATRKFNTADSNAQSYADAAEAAANSATDTKLSGYYTKSETESKISQSASEIETSVSNTYETKSDANSKLESANSTAQIYATAAEEAAKTFATNKASAAENNAKSYADGVADDAETAANNYTDSKLVNYVTGTEYSTFKQSVEGFETSVASTYKTISQAETDYTAIKEYSDEKDAVINAKFANYTTSEAFSEFRQTTNENVLSINSKITDINSDLLDINGELHGFLLLEDGNYLLAEDGDKIELEIRYTTLYETESLISEKQTEIELAVSAKYETQSSAEEREARLTLNIDGFKVEVSGTYETIANATSKYDEYDSEFELTKGYAVLKVNNNGKVASMALSADPSSTVGSEITLDASQITMTATQAINFLSGGDINLTGKNISITSTNFSLTNDGVITANSGTIGAWTINGWKIYGGDSSTGVAVMQKPSSSIHWVFAAGGTNHDSYADCPFKVDKSGNMYATKANITGAITASSLTFYDTLRSTSKWSDTAYTLVTHVSGAETNYSRINAPTGAERLRLYNYNGSTRFDAMLLGTWGGDLYYSAGTLHSAITHTCGFLTSSKTQVKFTIFLPKSATGLTCTVASGATINVRQNGYYIHGSSSGGIAPSSWACILAHDGYAVLVTATIPVSSYATNNDAVGVEFVGNLYFS